jgi:hypothetical protein
MTGENRNDGDSILDAMRIPGDAVIAKNDEERVYAARPIAVASEPAVYAPNPVRPVRRDVRFSRDRTFGF